jgi:hypothetical protein
MDAVLLRFRFSDFTAGYEPSSSFKCSDELRLFFFVSSENTLFLRV